MSLDEGFQNNLAASEHKEETGRNFGAIIQDIDENRHNNTIAPKIHFLKFAP